MVVIDGSHSSPTVVDLFCGAGGLSLGFLRAGFRNIWSADNDESAVATYNANLNHAASLLAITEDVRLPDASVIIGGPPCQGFSSAGAREAGDSRNTLVRVFAQLVTTHRPRAFVFENVEGFLTAEGGARVLDLLTPVIDAGYHVHLRKVNAANFGVPQHRKRVVAIGGRGWDPSFPEFTHNAYGAPGALRAGHDLPRAATVMEGLHGLPQPEAREPGNPSLHFCRTLRGEDTERAQHLGPGETMRDLPKRLRHNSYARRANRRVRDGTPTERRGGAPAGLRRLDGEQPSKAITSNAHTEFLHPTEDRYITLQECARLQTFPDDYRFMGGQMDCARLIGNAVPPRLAEVIATQLISDLQTAREEEGEGRLLSFVPTNANGMSPALRQTTESVERLFGANEQSAPRLPLWA